MLSLGRKQFKGFRKSLKLISLVRFPPFLSICSNKDWQDTLSDNSNCLERSKGQPSCLKETSNPVLLNLWVMTPLGVK